MLSWHPTVPKSVQFKVVSRFDAMRFEIVRFDAVSRDPAANGHAEARVRRRPGIVRGGRQTAWIASTAVLPLRGSFRVLNSTFWPS